MPPWCWLGQLASSIFGEETKIVAWAPASLLPWEVSQQKQLSPSRFGSWHAEPAAFMGSTTKPFCFFEAILTRGASLDTAQLQLAGTGRHRSVEQLDTPRRGASPTQLLCRGMCSHRWHGRSRSTMEAAGLSLLLLHIWTASVTRRAAPDTLH